MFRNFVQLWRILHHFERVCIIGNISGAIAVAEYPSVYSFARLPASNRKEWLHALVSAMVSFLPLRVAKVRHFQNPTHTGFKSGKRAWKLGDWQVAVEDGLRRLEVLVECRWELRKKNRWPLTGNWLKAGARAGIWWKLGCRVVIRVSRRIYTPPPLLLFPVRKTWQIDRRCQEILL